MDYNDKILNTLTGTNDSKLSYKYKDLESSKNTLDYNNKKQIITILNKCVKTSNVIDNLSEDSEG